MLMFLFLALWVSQGMGFNIGFGRPTIFTTNLQARTMINDPTDSYKTVYDMCFVERISLEADTLSNTGGDSENAKLESGLFVPTAKDGNEQPPFYLCKILSIGSGREREDGTIDLIDGGTPYPFKEGDEVVIKNPWGIGPKDEISEDGRKFSYVKVLDIAGVVGRNF